jgi:outer membrane protein assembly factor BamA
MRTLRLTVLSALIVLLPALVAAQPGEVIADIRVHGNHVTPSAEVVTIAGVTVGAPLTPTTLRDVEARLRDSRKFDEIQVLKRFASIVDPTQIALVLIVNEGAVRVEFEKAPDGEEVTRIVRRRGLRNLMYMPILNGEDGYGLTYGLTTSLANVAGERSRLSLPLSWGGTKRAALVLEKNFAEGSPLTRIEAGGAIQRRRNPAFEIDDDRERVWLRAERAINSVRLGVTGAWDQVTFAAIEDSFWTIGGDVALDTRLDPGYPRNAVWLSASMDRLIFEAGHGLNRTRLDGRGYVGLIRETVLALRVTREGASGAQPNYLRPLLGGWSNLRGFEAGRFHGDIVVTGSAELLVPLTSPMRVGKLGVSAFIDSGVAYDHGLKFSDQPRHTGVGGSLWYTATGFKLSLSVAHGRRDRTRVNFGGGFTF